MHPACNRLRCCNRKARSLGASAARAAVGIFQLQKAISSASICQSQHSAPNMTGGRFHRTTEAIPRRPWKSKSPFASGPMKISIKRGTRGGRGTTRYFLHSFPSCGPPVIQSYWSPKHVIATYVCGINPQQSFDCLLGTKKAWEWQCSSERSREQFRTV